MQIRKYGEDNTRTHCIREKRLLFRQSGSHLQRPHSGAGRSEI